MSEIVNEEQYALMQATYWERLRPVLAEYEKHRPNAREAHRVLVADVLLFMTQIEMDLAIAARDAGVKIQTGRLRYEQEWARTLPPIKTGHPRESE